MRRTKSSGVIDDIMGHEIAVWIRKRIHDLPESVRFRAFSSIRALSWANQIHDIELPIPATYSALHATEEAVASLVCCTKHYGYGEDAKINLRDHQEKAIVSFISSTISQSLMALKPALSYFQSKDIIVLRVMVDGEYEYGPATLSRLTYGDDKTKTPDEHFMNDILAKYKDNKEIHAEILRAQEARNKILYADNNGIPTGFLEQAEEIRRQCKISLSLIWACIDIHDNKNTKIKLIEQALKTARILIEDINPKKKRQPQVQNYPSLDLFIMNSL